MAAPLIPNLNTLRTGRGRGRGRGGRVAGSENGHSSQEEQAAAQDRIVQQTDLDASISRLSAVELGYWDDPFAKLFVSSEQSQRRFPIINRGTYVRTKTIDALVKLFLSANGQSTQKKQIISLGAGSDTRYFRLMHDSNNSIGHDELSHTEPNDLRANLIYHEYDFSENVTRKIAIIKRSTILSDLVGAPQTLTGNNNNNDTTAVGLDSATYHLHSLDLRSLNVNSPTTIAPPELQLIDTTVPTILISECCLVYLDPSLADSAARYFTHRIFPPSTPLGMILYEPIRPHDAFGKVMVSNLAARGIVLPTLWKYGSLEAQAARMAAYGFQGSQGRDVGELFRQVGCMVMMREGVGGVEEEEGEKEMERVAGLEMLDEVEEWELLAAHYCVVWGWRRGGADRLWNGWERFGGADELPSS